MTYHFGVPVKPQSNNNDLFSALKNCFCSRRANVILSVALVIGLLVRTYFLSQPMRFDEATTFNIFVKDGWDSVFSYVAPNNHVLHTIFVKISTSIFGDSPIAIRLPALTFGLLTIVAVFCAARLLGGDGSFAALVAAAHPYLILYSTNARGYTLITFLTLMLVILGYSVALRPSVLVATAWAFVSALGLLVMPTMLYPCAGIYLWVIYLGHKNRFALNCFKKYWLRAGVVTIFLTLLFYSPVIYKSGITSILNNEYVQSQSIETFVKALRWHIEGTVRLFFQDVPIPYTICALIFIAIGAKDLYEKAAGNRIISLLISCIFSAAAITLANHKIPFARTWIYLIPLFIIVADYGLAFVLQRCNQAISSTLSIILCLGAVWLSITLTQTRAIERNDDTGIFPAGPDVGQYLAKKIKSGDSVFIPCCENYPLFYYLWLYHAPPYSYNFQTLTADTYYVVPRGKRLEDLTDESPIVVFEANGTKIYYKSRATD